MSSLPKVLVIDDNEKFLSFISKNLSDIAEVLYADSIEGGGELFEKNTNAQLIIIGDFEITEANFFALIKKIKVSGFNNPVIHSSNYVDKEYRKMIRNIGNIEITTRINTPKLARELLEVEHH